MNAYVTAFVAACVTYMIMFSSLKKDKTDEYVNMEALMYSVGAGAIGFAIVQFMLQQSDSITTTQVAAPSPKVTNKPSNAMVGLTGETIMTDAFPSK